MTESQITGELLSDLRKKVCGVFIKHTDRTLIGVPDISATVAGRTTWIEVKLLKLRPRSELVFPLRLVTGPAVQYKLMCDLGDHGRALYVLFATQGRGRWWTIVLTPERIREIIADGLINLVLAHNEGKNFDLVQEAL